MLPRFFCQRRSANLEDCARGIREFKTILFAGESALQERRHAGKDVRRYNVTQGALEVSPRQECGLSHEAAAGECHHQVAIEDEDDTAGQSLHKLAIAQLQCGARDNLCTHLLLQWRLKEERV